MKKTIVKALCIFLSVVMLITAMPMVGVNLFPAADAAGADEALGAYPLDVSVSSDKTSYGALDVATFTVTIKNVSNSTVYNISSQSDFNGLSPTGKGNTYILDGVSLNAGESIGYSYKATINPDRLNFFLKLFLKIKRLFSGSENVPSITVNDGRNNTAESISVRFSKNEVTDTVTVWYKYDTTIVNTDTNEEFAAAVTSLVNDMGTVDVEQALDDAFYTSRVIAQFKSFEYFDFDSLNCDDVILRDDGMAILQFSSGALAKRCIDILSGRNDVVFAEPDYVLVSDSIEQAASDFDYSWGESYIGADKYAGYLSQNGKNNLVKVAVVDSGVDMEHPLLKGRLLSGGRDYVDGDTYPDDENGHGTHIAGIIADCTDNLNVKILPVRVLNADGNGVFPRAYTLVSSVAFGIEYAADAQPENVTFTCSDTGVAEISSEGKLTAKAPGKATVTVTTACGKSDSVEITVNEYIDVENIVLDKTAVSLAVSDTVKLNAAVSPANATDASVDWYSEDENIALVDDDGTVMAISTGTVNIVAISGTAIIAKCAVTVKSNYIFGIQTPSMTTIRHRDAIKLHVKLEGAAPENSYVKWSASNKNFKTEEINGGNSLLITSDKKGDTVFTATLYAADGNVLATQTIEMNSKAGFFDKIASFFRAIFGRTEVYES